MPSLSLEKAEEKNERGTERQIFGHFSQNSKFCLLYTKMIYEFCKFNFHSIVNPIETRLKSIGISLNSNLKALE